MLFASVIRAGFSTHNEHKEPMLNNGGVKNGAAIVSFVLNL
jgi:hypothetical protein